MKYAFSILGTIFWLFYTCLLAILLFPPFFVILICPKCTDYADEPVIKRGTAKRCAETFRTLGHKRYHECLCTRYKGGKAGFRKALG